LNPLLQQIRHHPFSRRNKIEFSLYALVAAVALGFIFAESGAAKSTWWYSTIFMLSVLIALMRIASIFSVDKGQSAAK
jgi:uncharacterized membrane protein YobD (UPF0266 family)